MNIKFLSTKAVGLAMVMLLFLVSASFAQTQSLQLIDKQNSKSIVGATYTYGSQHGMSDSSGYVKLEFQEDVALKLSHVAYGSWALSADELAQAIESGQVKKEVSSVNLFPVTIIGIHQHGTREQSINLSYEDQLAYDGGSILTQIPAINGIRKSGNYGIDPVMRGFKYEQLNIVMNGCQTAIAACPNRMDPPTSQMAPNMLGEIEVLKGPHALRYGNSIGGTINFKSGKPNFSDQNKMYGRVTGGFDSNGNNAKTEGLIGYSGKAYTLGLAGAYAGGNDYTDGEGNAVKAAYTRYSYGLNGAFQLNKNQILTISAYNNIAQDVDFPALPMDLRSDNTWMLNASHQIKFQQGELQQWNTTLYGSFVDHLMDNYTKNLDPRMVDAETNASTQSYGGRTEGQWLFANGLLYAGADLRIEGADGTRTRSFLMGPNMGKTVYDNVWQDGVINKTGAFAEYHMQGNHLQYIFSGRMELNSAQAHNPDPNFESIYPETSSTQWNPGLSAGAIYGLGHNSKIGLWVGRVQRSGSLTERYINYFPVGLDPYEMVGNPTINPEVNNQVDLTWSYSKQNTRISVDVFAAYLQDYISSRIDTNLSPKMPTSPGVRQYINLDQALQTGFEFSWGQSLWVGLSHDLGIAYTYGQDLERNEALPEIAPMDFRYRLYGTYFDNSFRPEISFRYVVEQSRISPEYGETVSPDFALVDLKFSYRFLKSWSIAAGVHNLFDETYYEHLNRSVKGTNPSPIYAPGRNIFFSVNLDLM